MAAVGKHNSAFEADLLARVVVQAINGCVENPGTSNTDLVFSPSLDPEQIFPVLTSKRRCQT